MYAINKPTDANTVAVCLPVTKPLQTAAGSGCATTATAATSTVAMMDTYTDCILYIGNSVDGHFNNGVTALSETT